MAGDHRRSKSSSRSNKSKKKHIDDTPSATSSSSPSSSSYSSTSDSDSDIGQERRKHSRSRHRSDNSTRKEKGERAGKSGKRKEKMDRDRKRKLKRRDKKRRSGRERKRRYSDDESDEDNLDTERSRIVPETIVKDMLQAYPNMASDLKQLLQMLDDGQAVDITGMSEKSLTKYLKKLFLSLKLKESDDGIFLLASNSCPTLEIVGSIIQSHIDSKDKKLEDPESMKSKHSDLPEVEGSQVIDRNSMEMPCPKEDTSTPRRRVIGPEMPSAELLAAAAKLTEAEAKLRESELDEDGGLFIGPPPPAMVLEAESANEAERFEEVTRIMGADVNSPYDVLAVNQNMSDNNVKKRYWKLSLMVHPDKCSHPQANQAFIIMNKAFKELQDPVKRKAMDDKIKLKEEQEAFKAELKAMREAAQWRRLQGISMEGDDELLAYEDMNAPRQRDEWMTTVPPERKPGGMPTHTTSFSKNAKEGRGDTSIWTDTPLDRAQKAKMNYLEAYSETAALASNEVEKKRTNSDADLVDKYNKANRSKSLLQKKQEESASRSKKKSKKQQPEKKEEWLGQHPWKPWDRENDLVAGRQNVKLDSENMSQGLTSRFSSGNFQRNFL